MTRQRNEFIEDINKQHDSSWFTCRIVLKICGYNIVEGFSLRISTSPFIIIIPSIFIWLANNLVHPSIM